MGPSLYNLIISLGITAASLSLLVLLWKLSKPKFPKSNLEAQNDAFSKWLKMTEKRLKQRKFKKGKLLIFMVLLLSVTFFLVGLFLFKNIPAAVSLGVAFLLIPSRLLQMLEDQERIKITEQLVSAIRIFASELIQTPHLEKGFAAVAARVPAPMGNYFADAYRDLIVGADPDHVLSNLAGKLDTDHGQMFVQLAKRVKEDSAVIALFPSLLEKIERYLELQRTNFSGLSGERLLTMFMSVAPIPAFLLMRKIIPETDIFVIETFAGRLMITIAFLSTVLWALIDRIAGRVQS